MTNFPSLGKKFDQYYDPSPANNFIRCMLIIGGYQTKPYQPLSSVESYCVTQ